MHSTCTSYFQFLADRCILLSSPHLFLLQRIGRLLSLLVNLILCCTDTVVNRIDVRLKCSQAGLDS